MKPYVIIFDMDGSLLNKQGQVSELTKKVVQKLRSDGHFIGLATGRPYGGAIQIYQELELDTPLITDNGGSIENPKDPKFARQKTYIPLYMMHDLFTYAKPFIISAFYTEDQMVYAYQYDTRLEEYFSGINTGTVLDQDMTNYQVPPTGLIYLIEEDHQKDLERFIDSNYGDTISYRLWGVSHGEAMYEIYLKHVSKASAIKYVINYLNLDISRWISFGDGINDYEMIKESTIGVAMKNAVPELFQVCKDVTIFDHDEDGIAKYLIEMFQLDIK